MKRAKLEPVTTEKICGKRERGRHGEEILDNLLSWHGKVLEQELIHAVGDYNMCGSTVAYASW